MKKILLASTTLLAMGAVSQASAAEPLTASVGGYMQIGLSFKDGEDGVGVLRDGEIHLKFKGSSDNGLTFDGRVELEATTSDANCQAILSAVDDGADPDLDADGDLADTCSGGDQIDENWARVSGSFGSIKIGGDDSAKNAYANGVIYSPGARIGYYDGFGDLGNVQPGISGNSDSIGIHYDSPDFNGFRFGATYQPRTNSDSHQNSYAGSGDSGSPVYNDGGSGDNTWSVGGVYSGDFGGFGVGVSAGYLTADGSDTDTWHVGGNVSASGFTVAVHYEDNAGAADSNDLAIGASYSTGPWTIAGGYGMTDTDTADPSVIAAWVTYALAPGVTANVGVEYGDEDDGSDEVLGGMAYMTLGF